MPGQIIKRGKSTWLVRIFVARDEQGKRKYLNKTIHGTKKEAESWRTAALRERDLGQFDGLVERKVRMSDLFALVRLDYEKNGKDYAWAERVIRVRLSPYFDALLASEVSTEAIDRYIVAEQAEGRSNGTINRALALLRRAFNLGKRASPPLLFKSPRIAMLKENNVRRGFLEWPEYERLLKELPDELRPVLMFAFYTGCRKSEILSLQWQQVDFIEGLVRLNPGETKNEEPRIVPLPHELSVTLRFLREKRDAEYPDSPWVFSRHGELIKSMRGAWDAACVAAGLVDGDGKPVKLFHDTRRSGVRNLVRSGVPERVAMAISGHKTRSVFDRYNIVSTADIKDAARRLDSYRAERQEQAKAEAERADAAVRAEQRHTIGTQAPSRTKRPGRPN